MGTNIHPQIMNGSSYNAAYGPDSNVDMEVSALAKVS